MNKLLLCLCLSLLGCAEQTVVAPPRWKAERIYGPDPDHRFYSVSCGYQKFYCFKRASDTCRGPWSEVKESDDSYSESHGNAVSNRYFAGARSDSGTTRQWSMMIRCE